MITNSQQLETIDIPLSKLLLCGASHNSGLFKGISRVSNELFVFMMFVFFREF
jgi:hypothetical protein